MQQSIYLVMVRIPVECFMFTTSFHPSRKTTRNSKYHITIKVIYQTSGSSVTVSTIAIANKAADSHQRNIGKFVIQNSSYSADLSSSAVGRLFLLKRCRRLTARIAPIPPMPANFKITADKLQKQHIKYPILATSFFPHLFTNEM